MLGSVTFYLRNVIFGTNGAPIGPVNTSDYSRRTRSSHMFRTRQNNAAVCSAS